MYKDNADYEYLSWLVHSRSENQRVTLETYRLIVAHKDIIVSNEDLQNIVQLLSQIEFSLWRAVFLSDNEEGMRLYSDAEAFMHNLIANNTVGYAQDKANRAWTFTYYVDNARHRLEALQNDFDFRVVDEDYNVNETYDSAQSFWDYHHRATALAVERLAAHLMSLSSPGNSS